MHALQFSDPAALGKAIPGELLEMAPLHLPNYRQVRYKAEDQFVPLARLAVRDRMLIRTLYAQLGDLVGRLTCAGTSDGQKLQDVFAWTEQYSLDEVVEQTQELGRASLADHADQQIAKAMHDIRGGALTSLLGYLQFLPWAQAGEKEMSNLYRLSRDQMKIMRSALTGLDDARRSQDTLPRTHDVELVLGKWHAVVVGPQVNYRSRPVRMFVDCRHQGALAECCLESAAVDRIFHNLTSNACRHAAMDRIDLLVFHVPPPTGPNLRFVLSNEIASEQVERLQALASRTPEGDLRALFEAGVSSTGSGYGMAVIADFVAGAFGLGSPREAVAEGYTGAVLHGSTFRVWFHWPVARGDAPRLSDDPHHPE